MLLAIDDERGRCLNVVSSSVFLKPSNQRLGFVLILQAGLQRVVFQTGKTAGFTQRIRDGNRITGASFCNAYFGSVKETSPGSIEIGALGSTRKTCGAPADSLEQRFRSSLSAATKYTFLAGKLALTASREGRLETLVFAPRPR